MSTPPNLPPQTGNKPAPEWHPQGAAGLDLNKAARSKLQGDLATTGLSVAADALAKSYIGPNTVLSGIQEGSAPGKP